MAPRFTHSVVTRDADGKLYSTSAARVVDGLVVEVAGVRDYWTGKPEYHERMWLRDVAFAAEYGRTVELVPDNAATYLDRIRSLVF